MLRTVSSMPSCGFRLTSHSGFCHDGAADRCVCVCQQHAPRGEFHDSKLFAVQPPPDDLLCGICGGVVRHLLETPGGHVWAEKCTGCTGLSVCMCSQAAGPCAG
jgi:hypothetical protein